MSGHLAVEWHNGTKKISRTFRNTDTFYRYVRSLPNKVELKIWLWSSTRTAFWHFSKIYSEAWAIKDLITFNNAMPAED